MADAFWMKAPGTASRQLVVLCVALEEDRLDAPAVVRLETASPILSILVILK